MNAESTLFNMQGNSMFPVLRQGDQGLVKPVVMESLRKGDIVVFNQDGKQVAHRLIRVTGGAHNPIFTTKGDFNHFCDKPFTENALKGFIAGYIRNGTFRSMDGFPQRISRFCSLFLPVTTLFFRRLRFRTAGVYHLMTGQTNLFFERFKRLISDAKGLYLQNAAAASLQGVIPFLLIVCIKKLVDKLSGSSLQGAGFMDYEIWSWLIGTALLFILGPLLTSIYRPANEALNDRINRHAYRLLHQKHTNLDLKDYELPGQQDAMHQAAREAGIRPVRIVNETLSLVRSGASVVVMMVLFLQLRWYLVLLLLVAVLPGTYIRLKFARHRYLLRQNQSSSERRMNYFSRILTGEAFAKELRLFGFASHFTDRFEQLEEELYTEKRALLKKTTRSELIGTVLSGLLVFTSLAIVVSLMFQGLLSLGSVVLYVFVFQRGYSVLGETLNAITSLVEDNTFLNDFFGFLNSPEEEEKKPDRKPDALQQGIRLENVTFSYENSRREALSDINLTIPAGSTVAIVGPNGSGKTTLLKLLCGFYQPTGGRIYYDDVPMQDLHKEALRDQITAVFQDYALYNLSAAENIALGSIGRVFDMERVKWAAGEAAVAELLENLPEGYDTMLGHLFENGEDISLGQWQKIAIARAFYRDAPLVFMDEPSSALDATSEHQILDSLKKLGTGKTVVIVSHRLTTVCRADRIIVLEKGKLVEEGDHQSLMAQKGLYCKLFREYWMDLPNEDKASSC